MNFSKRTVEQLGRSPHSDNQHIAGLNIGYHHNYMEDHEEQQEDESIEDSLRQSIQSLSMQK